MKSKSLQLNIQLLWEAAKISIQIFVLLNVWFTALVLGTPIVKIVLVVISIVLTVKVGTGIHMWLNKEQ